MSPFCSSTISRVSLCWACRELKWSEGGRREGGREGGRGRGERGGEGGEGGIEDVILYLCVCT